MTTVWIIFIGLQIVSFLTLCSGVFLYRRILLEHRHFIHSLQHTEVQEKTERFGRLATFYVMSTLLVIIASTLAFTFSSLNLYG
jgi:hypothetical protein